MDAKQMPDSKNDNPKTKQNKLMSPINLPGFGYMNYEGVCLLSTHQSEPLQALQKMEPLRAALFFGNGHIWLDRLDVQLKYDTFTPVLLIDFNLRNV